jgi:uncharacterized protein YkwD
MRRLSPLFFFALLVACPGPAQRTQLGTEQGDEEIPTPAPSVASYDTTAPDGESIVGGGDVAGVAVGIQAAAQARSVALTADPRLATLSSWIADRLGPSGDPPTAEILEFFAWNLGLVEPVPHVIVLGLPDRASIPDQVQRAVDQFLARQTYTHYGAVMLPRDGVWLVVITLSWRFPTFEPVPRAPTAGPLTLRGSLDAAHHNPVIAVQAPNGEVSRLPAGAGPAFDVRVPLAAGNGEYHVEILARGEHGESVMANFPVYLGVPIPTVLHLHHEATTSGGADVATVHDDLLRLLNETRAEAGLAPLTIDPRIEEIALAHSHDMVEHDFTGHESPTTGSPADRVRASGLHSGLVLENIGRGYSATEIHRGLLASPGHRANLVNPDANVVGIGVVADESDGRTAFVVTQVFLRFAQPIDVSGAPAIVLEAINHARTARGASALSSEPNLQAAADASAREFFSDPTLTTQDAVDHATTSLRRFSIAFRRLGGLVAVVTALGEAEELEPSFDDDVDYVGIGVAQGTRPDTGENAIVVVIMLGWAR